MFLTCVVGRGAEAESSLPQRKIMSATEKKKKKKKREREKKRASERNGNRNIHLENLKQITQIIS